MASKSQKSSPNSTEAEKFRRLARNLIAVSNIGVREQLADEAKRRKAAPKRQRKTPAKT